MCRRRRAVSILALIVLAALSACVQPRERSYAALMEEETPAKRKNDAPRGAAFQLMFGITDYDDLTFERRSDVNPGVAAETDLENIPFMGIAGQAPLIGEDVAAGMEGGFTIGAWGDSDKVAFNNNTLAVELDSFLFLTDIFVGAYAAAEIERTVRFYAGAGPLLMFGYYEQETEDADSRDTVVKIDDDEAALGVGLYARAGIEFRVGGNTLFGIGARAVNTTLNFGGDVGDVDVEGVQFMATFGIGF